VPRNLTPGKKAKSSKKEELGTKKRRSEQRTTPDHPLEYRGCAQGRELPKGKGGRKACLGKQLEKDELRRKIGGKRSE